MYFNLYIRKLVDEFTLCIASGLLEGNPEQLAWWLVESISGKTRVELYTEKYALSDEEIKRLESAFHDIVYRHKPFQYVVGTLPFCGLDLKVEYPVFIPRPETEEWCLQLCKDLNVYADKRLRILELCTGSGAIALALAHRFPNFTVVAVDITDHALELARLNQQRNALVNVSFIKSDMYTTLTCEDRFDIIISNPPYLSEAEWEVVDKQIRFWEDKRAFVAQHNGLAFYEIILKGARSHLRSLSDDSFAFPRVVLEIGASQADAVIQHAYNVGFSHVKVFQDSAGYDRILYASF